MQQQLMNYLNQDTQAHSQPGPGVTQTSYDAMPVEIQYWLVFMVTLNTMINVVVFLKHRWRKNNVDSTD